jgi:MFS family permease
MAQPAGFSTTMSQPNAHSTGGGKRILEAISALRHRNYRLYWFGQLSSVLAQNMEHVAQGWLVLELTNSPLALGLTGLSHAIPTITLTLVGGAVADRADRRRIMIASQTGSALMFLTIAVLVLTGQIALWHVMTLAFISGSIRAFDRPSRMALLPQMVPREDIPNAVAIGGTIWQLCRLVGPAAAGILIHLFGVGPTFLACCIASSTAVILWLAIRTVQPALAASGGGLLKNMMEGVNFIRKNELYYSLMGMTFFNSVFGMSYLILMPVFARDILQVGSQGFGFLQTAGGAGALIGTLSVATFSNTRRLPLQAARGAAVFGALLLLFAFSRLYPLSLALAFVLGMVSQFYITAINTVLQLNLPEQLRGRVMGVHGLTWDLMPVGGMIAGTIAEFAGAPAAVAVGAVFVAGLGLWIMPIAPRLSGVEKWQTDEAKAPKAARPLARK